MIISAVDRIPRRRSRVHVFLDGISGFEISAAAARTRGLVPGREITPAEVDAVVVADERRRAMDTAAAMLARRRRSERELRRRLARGKHDQQIIDETIARLRELRLLDDAEFARSWTDTRDRTSPRARRLIVQELRAAGVDTTIASAAASAVSDEDAAGRLAQRRLRSLESLDYDAFRARLGTYLQRRGFAWDTVRTTVDRCWRDLGRSAPTD